MSTNSIEKRVSAYLFGNRIFIEHQLQTVDGVWIGAKPVFVIENVSDVESIKQAIKKSFEYGSEERVIHPKDQKEWSDNEKIILDAVGVKSYKKFSQESKFVNIEKLNNIYSFRPTKNWFYEKELTPFTTSNIEELGSILLEAFKNC